MRNFTFEIQTVVVAADVIERGAPSWASIRPYLQSIKEWNIFFFFFSPSSSSSSSSSFFFFFFFFFFCGSTIQES